jgi:hypothetical protein
VRLKEVCTNRELIVDPAVFEAARILRVPGTKNHKQDPALPIYVLTTGQAHSVEEIKSVLGVKESPAGLFGGEGRRPMTALGEQMLGNSQSSFDKIIRKGVGGCRQLVDCFVNRATLSEPRWFDALSVAAHCKDRETAIHKLSKGHAGYDAETTEKKANNTKGPHSCIVFENNNPGGCAGCPHKGKITSPIMLGREVAEAAAEDNIVEETREAPDGTVETLTYRRPEIPFPYFWGKTGGIYRRPSKEMEDLEEPKLVYPHDFYLVKLMTDDELGDVAVFRLHLPVDGLREFNIPLSKVTETAELRKALATKGIVCGKACAELLLDYTIRSISEYQCNKRSEIMRKQFGWADNDTKFVIGEKEFTAEGVFHSPPSSATMDRARYFGPVGSFDKWKEVFALYGQEGLEPHAFAALTAFGSPLIKFFGQTGGIISLVHPFSGTGKTTVLRMCNSVWGRPQDLMLTEQDTYNAKIAYMGIYGNLPVCVDEMTNSSPAEISGFAYGASYGRGKERLMASSNQLRNNNTTWRTIALCSSNASFYEKLEAHKSTPQGELMRILEYKIDYSKDVDVEFYKRMFDHVLMENYGHAGEIYARYLVANIDKVRALCTNVQNKIDTDFKIEQRERIWSSIIAANIAGGFIAKGLGILDWNLNRIYTWASALVDDLRNTSVPQPIIDSVAVVGDYINKHINNILVVNERVDARTKFAAAPQTEPKGELLIRYEPDTHKLYITRKPFRDYCVDRQINYKEVMAELQKKGAFLGMKDGMVQKRISKGMKHSAPAVACIMLDVDNPDFFDMEEFIAESEAEALVENAD